MRPRLFTASARLIPVALPESAVGRARFREGTLKGCPWEERGWRALFRVVADRALDLLDERLRLADDRLALLLADPHDHHPIGTGAVDEHERAAGAADVAVGEVRAVEHQVRIRRGARDGAVLVDAVAHRR